MKTQIILALSGVTLCLFSHARAANITKADNLSTLATGGSWAGGTAPGPSDTAVFDATYLQTGNLDTGAALTWAGLRVTGGTTAINIANTTPENTISLGSGGVALGAARALTLPNTKWLADQTWTAAASSTLTIGNTAIHPQAFTLQLTSAGMTVKKGTTTLPFAGTSTLAKFVIGDDTLNSQPNAGTVTSVGDLTVSGHFAIGEAAPAVFIQTAGTVHSTAAASGFGSGLNLGHRGGVSRYQLQGGTLKTNAPMVIGAGGGNTGTLEISGGIARLKGLNLTTSTSAIARIDLTAGRLDVGSAGIIATAAGTRTLNLGGGILGATANWSTNQPLVFTGTNGNTTIDTLDAVDAASARTITVSGASSGAGGFVKTGEGTLEVNGPFAHRGDSTVNGGTLLLGTSGSLRLFPTADQTSNRITGSGALILDGTLEIDLTQAAVATGNSWLLIDATQPSYGTTFAVRSTTGAFTPKGNGTHVFADTDGNTWTFHTTTGRLSVMPMPPLLWNNASGNNLWDTVSLNWNDGSANATFADGDKVRFEDTVNAMESITVNYTLAPLTMTFANTALTGFEVGGSGTLAGAGSLIVNQGGQVKLANTGGLSFAGALKIDSSSLVQLATKGDHASTTIGAGSVLELLAGASLKGPVSNAGSLVHAAESGTLTLAGVVSGNGSIIQDGTSTLALAAVNTHTGTVIIRNGTLRLERGAQLYQTGAFFGVQNQSNITIATGGTFETWNWEFGVNNALSRLRHNYGQILLDGGTIRFTESATSYRAFTVGTGGGTLDAPTGTTFTKVAGTLASENIIRFATDSTLTITGGGNVEIRDDLGAYGATGFHIAKKGPGSLTLSGTNTYTGTTTVSEGSLLVNGTALADGSSLVIDGGVVIPSGTETVGRLFFGGTQQAAGTWGASGSGALHIDDTRFSGTDGVIQVTIGPPGQGFASWAAANGTAGTIGDDHDRDGVPNGVEYFLGGPNSITTGTTTLPGVVKTAGDFTVTWTMAADYAGTYATDFVVETSANPGEGWTTETLGTHVTINGRDVSYTFPRNRPRTFVRLAVSGP